MPRLILGHQASDASNTSSHVAAAPSESSLRASADAFGASGSGSGSAAFEDALYSPTGGSPPLSRRQSWNSQRSRRRPETPQSDEPMAGVGTTLSLVREVPSIVSQEAIDFQALGSDQPVTLPALASRRNSRDQALALTSESSRPGSRSSFPLARAGSRSSPFGSETSASRISLQSESASLPGLDYRKALFKRAKQFHEQEDLDLLEIPVVDANRTGIIPCLSFTVTWVISVAGVLSAFVVVYAFQEVLRVETLARNLGVDHARLHIGEVLSPAVAAVGAVQTAYSSGALTSLSGYANITRLLAPHFAACPALREVELIAAPGALDPDGAPLGAGSVLVGLSWSGALELRTDRADCAAAPLPAGCAAEPLRTEESAWYRRGFGVGMEWWYTPPPEFWYGPSFLHDMPHEADCEEICWSPTYAYVGRVAAGRLPSDQQAGGAGEEVAAGEGSMEAITTTGTTSPLPTASPPSLPSVLVRAAVDSRELQKVAVAVEEIARAEVFICSDKGEMVAASDMADVMYVDDGTGILRPAFVWELAKPWLLEWGASEAGTLSDFVRKADGDKSFEAAGYRVSAHVLGGPTNSTASLGAGLRLIIAVPGHSFIDSTLGPLVMPALAASAAPFAVVGLLSVLAGYLKFCVRSQSLQISPLTRLS